MNRKKTLFRLCVRMMSPTKLKICSDMFTRVRECECVCVAFITNCSAKTTKAFPAADRACWYARMALLYGYRLYEPEPKQLNKFLNEL